MLLFSIIFILINFKLFYPIFVSKEVIISYGIHPFDICSQNPDLWKILKFSYVICCLFSNFIFGNFIYNRILIKFKFFQNQYNSKKPCNFSYIPTSENCLNLLIGHDSNNCKIFIPEKGLYQNFLVTGTIGSGKTSSCMYPFTRQLIEFNSKNPKKKIGIFQKKLYLFK